MHFQHFRRDSETLHAFTNNLTIQKKAVGPENQPQLLSTAARFQAVDLVVAENYKSFTHLNKAMAKEMHNIHQISIT